MSTSQPRSLSSLTVEEIQKALDLTKKDMILEGNVVLLTDDRYKKALDFLKEHFVPDIPMFKSLGIQWSEELADIRYRSALKSKFSFVLEDTENNQIIAIRLTKIAKRGSSLDLYASDDVLLREICRAEITADKRAKFYEYYGVDEAVQFIGLGVHRKHRRKGLATKLIEFYLKFLVNLGVSPLYLKAGESSNYSKRVYESLGFEMLYELKFDEYFSNGKQVFSDTGNHKSMKCYGYKVC